MELEEIKKLSIYEKLQFITNEIGAVAKNLEVGYGKSKYQAVGEADVLKAVKPLESKYRVYSYPFNREIVETNNFTTTNVSSDGEQKEKLSLFMRLKVTYRFINIDNTNEFIDIVSYGDGIDPQDKCTGKAMTYADKYALMKAYKIITGDDPDQEASEPMKKEKKVKVSEQTINELKAVGGTLEIIAEAYKCTIYDLTEEVVKQIIEQKKKKLEELKNTQDKVEV